MCVSAFFNMISPYFSMTGGHDSVVLGALGCGVFANSPEAAVDFQLIDVDSQKLHWQHFDSRKLPFNAITSGGHSQRVAQAATARLEFQVFYIPLVFTCHIWCSLRCRNPLSFLHSMKLRRRVRRCFQGGCLCRYLQQEELCRFCSDFDSFTEYYCKIISFNIWARNQVWNPSLSGYIRQIRFWLKPHVRHNLVTLGHAVETALEVQITEMSLYSIWSNAFNVSQVSPWCFLMARPMIFAEQNQRFNRCMQLSLRAKDRLLPEHPENLTIV